MRSRKESKKRAAPTITAIPPTTKNRPSTIVRVGIFAVVLVAASVVRFLASLDDFWLDEIWSWSIAMQLTGPLDVITRVHHDNNHYLNTLVLYACGRDAPFFLYRLPAVVAGIGTVVLAGTVARKWGSLGAVTATLVTGCSFLLIQYSSEARGYAYLMLFTAASFAVLQESLDRQRAIWEILFAIFAVLGFLSHPTYAFAYISFLSWSVWHRIFHGHVDSDGWFSKQHVVPLILELLVPAAFVVFMYQADWRYLEIGGGDESSSWRVFAQATSAAFGGPLEGLFILPVAAAVLIIAVGALYQLYSSGSDLWVPMIVGIFILPVIIFLVVQPEAPYPRYFLISMLFLQLLLSWFLTQIFERPQGRIVYLLTMAVVLTGNIYLTNRLLKDGRGGYESAVNYLLSHSERPQVIVASDHDFRNKMVLGFYLWRAGATQRAAYVDRGHWPPQGPEWLIVHDFTQNFSPPTSINIDPTHHYQLAQAFPHFGLSGWNWALYHQTARENNLLPSAKP